MLDTFPQSTWQTILENFKEPGTTICNMDVKICELIFVTDGWFTSVPNTTKRFVTVLLERDESGRYNLDVARSRVATPWSCEVDIEAVKNLGIRKSTFTINEALENQGLFAAVLFSVIGNKGPLVEFAKWYLKHNKANQNVLRLEPSGVQAAHIHIAWLHASCPGKQLEEASYDPVVKECGIHHEFPTQADLYVEPYPPYISRYIDLWESKCTDLAIRALMDIDYEKFRTFTEFLTKNPECVF